MFPCVASVALVLLALSASLVSAAPAAAKKARNVLFLFEDDGGLALGAYGDKAMQSPHLDALAARGTVFDAATTSVSSCSPSRASLLTGIPTHQNGQWGLLNSHFYSFAHVRSLPNVLSEAGVATGVHGKFHVATAGGLSPTEFYNFSWGNSPTGPGGCRAGASDACPDTDYNLVSRNISYIAEGFSSFLDFAGTAPFFMYIGWGDSHRCGGAVGEFCESYGRAADGTSTIPGWKPLVVAPSNVQLPFWVQDTPIAREDYAHMYTAKNRMDQGVGMVMAELYARGLENDTLVIYTADNGAPFAAGKTNFYTPGMGEPLIISVPGGTHGARSSVAASMLDLAPTIYDWLGVAPPQYRLPGGPVRLQGRSLLPFLNGAPAAPRTVPHPLVQTTADVRAAAAARGKAAPAVAPLPAKYDRVYGSFQWHEQQMYYPMRVVIASDAGVSSLPTFTYKLIYNIASPLTYPIASDLYAAPAFQDLLNRSTTGQPTHWYRNFTEYLSVPRPRFQLFDLLADPSELVDRATDAAFGAVLSALQADIKAWQTTTNDDWLIKYDHE